MFGVFSTRRFPTTKKISWYYPLLKWATFKETYTNWYLLQVVVFPDHIFRHKICTTFSTPTGFSMKKNISKGIIYGFVYLFPKIYTYCTECFVLFTANTQSFIKTINFYTNMTCKSYCIGITYNIIFHVCYVIITIK